MILEDYQDNTPKIKVYIRKRPLGKKEIMRNEQDILEIRDVQTVVVKENKYFNIINKKILIVFFEIK